MSTIVDNASPGFTKSGPWQLESYQGYNGSEWMLQPGNAGSWAEFLFANLAAGMYQFACTWIPYMNRASAAPVEIYDGTGLVWAGTLNQITAPQDFQETAWWRRLGPPVPIASGTGRIRLHASTVAGEQTIADAAWGDYVGPINQNPPPSGDLEAARQRCLERLAVRRDESLARVLDEHEKAIVDLNADLTG